jgi:exopolysaccharide biosynthesis polyprenyl glycosylphosphotransferase
VTALDPFARQTELDEDQDAVAGEAVVRLPETDGAGAPHEGGPTDTVVLLPEVRGTALAGLRRMSALLVGLDVLTILIALASVQLAGAGSLGSRDFLLVAAVAPVVWVGIFHSFGLYGLHHLSAPEEFRRVISATTLGVLVIIVGGVWWQHALDRPSLGLAWLVGLFAELGVRRAVRWRIGKGRADGSLALRTVIVGTNVEAESIADALSLPVRGFVPVGFVATAAANGHRLPLPVLGTIEQLSDVIRRTSAECVFVASTAVSSLDVYEVSRCCRRADAEMRVSANAGEILTSRVSVHQVRDLMVFAVRSARLTRTQALLKRSFDVVIASAGLAVTLPVMAVVALAVRATSSGAVLFRQERITKDGRRFTVYKFRTMLVDSERRLGAEVFDLTQPFFKVRRDPRLTRIGGLLRSWSLDELPQLWNVVRGDMSLVGPRPLAADQVEANRDLLDARHEVRAGLTGWWQINGRSEVDVAQALKMDLFYIENWSLALDLYVLLKTVGVVLARKGAY